MKAITRKRKPNENFMALLDVAQRVANREPLLGLDYAFLSTLLDKVAKDENPCNEFFAVQRGQPTIGERYGEAPYFVALHFYLLRRSKLSVNDATDEVKRMWKWPTRDQIKKWREGNKQSCLIHIGAGTDTRKLLQHCENIAKKRPGK